MKRWFMLLLFTGITFAQGVPVTSQGFNLPPFGYPHWDVQVNSNFSLLDNILTGQQPIPFLDFAFLPKIVSTLPVASSSTGRTYRVTDGSTVADCTIGGGSSSVLCTSTGVVWQSVGTSSASVPTGVTKGAALVANGVGLAPIYQTKPYVDVRDWGVSCTGAAGDAAILNSHTNTLDGITGLTIVFPVPCTIMLNAQWLIFGSEGWRLQGSSKLASNPIIQYCGASSSASSAIKIERSGGWIIEGLTIASSTAGCAFPSTVAVIVDNDSGGGYNTTDGQFDRDSFNTAMTGGPITNWVGISLSPVSPNNVEDMKFIDSHIFCNSSVNSTGVNLNSSFNAKMEEFRHTNFSDCTLGVNSVNGDLYLTGEDSGGNGAAIGLGPGSDPALVAKVTSEDNQLLATTGRANWPDTILSSHVGWNGAASAGLCGFDFGTWGGSGHYLLIGSGADAVPVAATGAFPLCSSPNTDLIMIGNQFNGVVGSGNSGFLLPQGHNFSNTYSWLNGGRMRMGHAANFGNEDIGYGFFTQFGVDVSGLGWNAQSSDDCGGFGGSLCIGKDAMYLGDAQIVMKAMWPIPEQSTTCAVSGTPGSTHWRVFVIAKDAAGNRSGWQNLAGNSGCFGANATLSGSNFLTVTFPRVTRAVSYDLVLANPASQTQGVLGINVADPGGAAQTVSANIISGSTGSTFNYAFPNYYDSAQTTINGESLTIAAPTTFSKPITSTLAIGTAPLVITSTTPVANLTVSQHPQVYEAGVLTASEKIYTNTQALTAGAATHTLASAFTYTSSATFGCTCTDQTAANSCKAVPASATTVTLAGTGTDVLWLSCSGH